MQAKQNLKALLSTMQRACEEKDWDQLTGLDESIRAEIETLLPTINNDKERESVAQVLKIVQRIYGLVISETTSSRDEIALELKRLSRDQRAVNAYLDSSGHI